MAEQKVTTYYKEAKQQEEGEKHHAERRELNRKLRREQEPASSKVKRAAREVKGIITPAASKVTGFLKERSAAVAHEMRDVKPRKQKYGGALPSGSMGYPTDPFGVGGFGGMNANPWNNPMQPEPRQAPRKRRKKRRAPANQPPRRSGGNVGMMGIPKHMRWMF